MDGNTLVLGGSVKVNLKFEMGRSGVIMRGGCVPPPQPQLTLAGPNAWRVEGCGGGGVRVEASRGVEGGGGRG